MNRAWLVLLAVSTSSIGHTQSAIPVLTSSTGSYNGTNILAVLDSQMKSYASLTSPSGGYLKTAIAGEAKVNFNGKGGAAYGVWGMAQGTGQKGQAGALHDIVGVAGTAKKSGAYWAAGVHADCLDTLAGGVCIGVNIEFPEVTNQSTILGVNMQPAPHAQNVVGIQFQHPSTYRYSIDAQNTYIKVGQTGATPFCMRFNSTAQVLEFWRGCQNNGATRVGYINMNPGVPDGQMN